MFLSLSFLFFFFWMGKQEPSCRRMAARQAGAIAMSSDSAPLFGGVSGYIPITSHPCGELQLTHCPEQDFPHHNPKSGVLGWDRGGGGSSQEAAPPPPFWVLGVRGGTCSSSDAVSPSSWGTPWVQIHPWPLCCIQVSATSSLCFLERKIVEAVSRKLLLEAPEPLEWLGCQSPAARG